MSKLLLSATLALTIGAFAAVPIALSAAPPGFVAKRGDTCLQPASAYAFKVGDSELMALCDGSVPCDLQKVLRDCSEAERKQCSPKIFKPTHRSYR